MGKACWPLFVPDTILIHISARPVDPASVTQMKLIIRDDAPTDFQSFGNPSDLCTFKVKVATNRQSIRQGRDQGVSEVENAAYFQPFRK